MTFRSKHFLKALRKINYKLWYRKYSIHLKITAETLRVIFLAGHIMSHVVIAWNIRKLKLRSQ